MANRINLNATSYHGAGAIAEIANEAKAHGFKKAFVCSDPDLIKFNVTSKVTDILTANASAAGNRRKSLQRSNASLQTALWRSCCSVRTSTLTERISRSR